MLLFFIFYFFTKTLTNYDPKGTVLESFLPLSSDSIVSQTFLLNRDSFSSKRIFRRFSNLVFDNRLDHSYYGKRPNDEATKLRRKTF